MKKNILFIFLRYSENPKDSALMKDLSDEFKKQGQNVYIATMLEKKYGRETELNIENGCNVLRIRTGNYFDTSSKLEKAITAFTLPYIFKKEIIKKFGDINFSFIFTHTPFVSNAFLINSLKNFFECPAYLQLWDIFPQNSKDLGILKNPLLIKYFRYREKKMYNAFDYIGCMSKGNISYIKKHNSKDIYKKLHLLRNWSIIKPRLDINKTEIRETYGFSSDDFIAIFGGNMGKPQKLDNIIELADRVKKLNKLKFLFVGRGTEKERIKKIVREKRLNNVIFKDYIPRKDYEKLAYSCDIGLVSLDERFTVPNFPSKTIDYFKLELPILASLDKCALNDYGDFLENKSKAGLACLAGNFEEYEKKLKLLIKDKKLRKELGQNGRLFYEENLDVKKAYRTIMNTVFGN